MFSQDIQDNSLLIISDVAAATDCLFIKLSFNKQAQMHNKFRFLNSFKGLMLETALKTT